MDISTFDIILVIAYCQEAKVSFFHRGGVIPRYLVYHMTCASRDMVRHIKIGKMGVPLPAFHRARLHARDKKNEKELNLVNEIFCLFQTILYTCWNFTNVVINIKFIYS